MPSLIKNVLAIFFMLIIGQQTSLAAPADFHARYITSKSGFSLAKTDIRLNRQSDGTLVYISETVPLGILSLFRSDHITEKTILENPNGKTRPVRFQHIHKGSKKNRDIDLTFDWGKHLVTNSISGKQWSLAIPEGAIDEFSLQIFLMQDLFEGKTKKLEYPIADDGELKIYRFEILGTEKMEVPIGTFNTIKIKRVREKSERITYMWAAPSLHYLPVRIEHVEDDSKFAMEIEQLRGELIGGKSLPADADWE